MLVAAPAAAAAAGLRRNLESCIIGILDGVGVYKVYLESPL